MKDLHTHILYGIDDGVKTIEESIKILNDLATRGVTDIVLTPHYIEDTTYNANNEEKRKRLEVLKQKLSDKKTNINLYLGNEVYIDENIPNLLEKEISTINGGKYILMELPLNSKSLILDEVLYKLSKLNLIPIIAHPERYSSYYKDYDFFSNLIEKGCLLQLNLGSIYGSYRTTTTAVFQPGFGGADDPHHSGRPAFDHRRHGGFRHGILRR